ncbi:RNA-binding motif protein, X-linked 2-like protein [Lates japonicus]|uniref:RNA-binding motif protein, X-linked 2 n=1 Tax=Lates japonicus TaxID=270547 RepID=A0AAD3NFX9_LATJO|nr:RNA-binding motif protein, X-linked 2-like protein [Lates japonicus]
MNPLTKVKLINELNEREANLGVNESVSWHNVYKDSAWIFVGGFPYELTEGDIICVFSQYGEVVNINLVRDKKTGKSKGFCFICYEDQRSTILAVDNFNGIKIKGRTIRVDHVKDYRPPKDSEDIDDVTKHLREEGCAPKAPEPPSSSSEEEEQYSIPVKKPKKDKKEKKKKKKEKKEKKKKDKEKERGSRATSSSSPPPPPTVRVKEEKEDAAYDKYNQRGAPPGEQENGQRARENERLRGEEPPGDGSRSTFVPLRTDRHDALHGRCFLSRYLRSSGTFTVQHRTRRPNLSAVTPVCLLGTAPPPPPSAHEVTLIPRLPLSANRWAMEVSNTRQSLFAYLCATPPYGAWPPVSRAAVKSSRR